MCITAMWIICKTFCPRSGELRNLGKGWQLALPDTFKDPFRVYGASPVAQWWTPPSVREARVRSLGQEDPLEEEMATHSPVFLPGESHGQRSLAGYSPWGLKELDMTKATGHTHQSLYLAEFGGFKSSGKVFLVFWIMLLHFRYLMNS